MRRRAFPRGLMLAALLTISGVAFAQAKQPKRTLVINGQATDAAVIQLNGRSYVDLEMLARSTNGSLRYQGNTVVLTLPAAAASNATPTADSQSGDVVFSKDFMEAGIQAMGAIKEWRSRLAYGIRHAYPGDGSGLVPYRDRAAEAVRLTTVAASNSTDQSGMQLVTNHFNNVDQWANQMVAARKNMDANISMSPDALNNDPLFQKIKACADFLPAMLGSGRFADDQSCH